MVRRLLVCILFCGACATAGAPSSGRPSQDWITRSDLERNPGGTAHDIVQRLRPQWLRIRGPQSVSRETDLVVYVDNARMGGRESLRSISLAGVEFLRFLDPAEATLRWGTGHSSGAILISTNPEME